METTLEQIHLDPKIIDRAIESGVALDIVADGQIKAVMTPSNTATWRRPMGPLPDFAKRRAELHTLGMRPLSPEEYEEFVELVRSDREI